MIYGIGIVDCKTRNFSKQFKSYCIWKDIISRCYNPKHKYYKNYGAKGVRVCDEWLRYSNFKKWYDDNYIEDYHLDKDTIGSGLLYSPKDCIFITKRDNVRDGISRRDNSYLEKDEEYFRTTPVFKQSFKKVCERKGWDIKEFECIFKEKHVFSNGKEIKKYIFIKKIERC